MPWSEVLQLLLRTWEAQLTVMPIIGLIQNLMSLVFHHASRLSIYNTEDSTGSYLWSWTPEDQWQCGASVEGKCLRAISWSCHIISCMGTFVNGKRLWWRSFQAWVPYSRDIKQRMPHRVFWMKCQKSQPKDKISEVHIQYPTMATWTHPSLWFAWPPLACNPWPCDFLHFIIIIFYYCYFKDNFLTSFSSVFPNPKFLNYPNFPIFHP